MLGLIFWSFSPVTPVPTRRALRLRMLGKWGRHPRPHILKIDHRRLWSHWMRLADVLTASMAVSELHVSGTGQYQVGSFFIILTSLTIILPLSSKWISTDGGRATAIPRNETVLRLFDLAVKWDSIFFISICLSLDLCVTVTWFPVFLNVVHVSLQCHFFSFLSLRVGRLGRSIKSSRYPWMSTYPSI